MKRPDGAAEPDRPTARAWVAMVGLDTTYAFCGYPAANTRRKMQREAFGALDPPLEITLPERAAGALRK